MSNKDILKTVFITFTFILSFFVWIKFDDVFNLISVSDLVIIAIFLFLFSGLLLLSLFLFSDNTPLYILLSFLLVFFMVLGIYWWYLFVVFIILFLFFYAKEKICKNKNNNLEIRFYPLSFFGAPTIITIIAILVAVASYSYPFAINKFEVNSKAFSFVEPIIDFALEMQMPFYEKGMNIDDILVNNIKNQTKLSSKIIKEKYGYEIVKQREKIAKDLNINLTGKENVNEFLAKVANSYIKKILTPNERFIPIFIAFTVFITIKSFSFILNRLIVFFAWIFYKILLRFNFIKIDTVSVNKKNLKVV